MENLAISISGLTKQYKNGTQALRGINLEVKQGEFFALLGANGAGKTTVIGILTGLVNKTAGKVSGFGFDLDTQPNEIRRMIGVVPQEFNFSIFEKVEDIVVQQAGYFGVPRKIAIARAEEILKALNLWEKRNVMARTLSGGMKRRLMIARALINQPKLLILDEPTAGVDVELRYEMWEYLKKLNQSGVTILLTTHYLEEVEQLCEKVAIIKLGEVITNDTVKNLVSGLEKQTFVVTVNKLVNDGSIENYDTRLIDVNSIEVDLGMNSTVNDLVLALNEAGMIVQDLRPKGNRIEQLYLNIHK